MKTKKMIIYTIVAWMAILLLHSCQYEGEMVYPSFDSRVSISCFYSGEYPVELLVDGKPLIISSQAPSTVFTTGEVGFSGYLNLQGTPDTLPLAIRDTVSGKELYTGEIHRNEQGSYNLKFAFVDGKFYDAYNKIEIFFQVYNFSDAPVTVVAEKPVIP